MHLFYVLKFSAVVQIMTFCGQIHIRYGVDLTLKLNKLMQKEHLLMVLFGKNPESTLASKYKKQHIQSRFNAQFSLVSNVQINKINKIVVSNPPSIYFILSFFKTIAFLLIIFYNKRFIL